MHAGYVDISVPIYILRIKVLVHKRKNQSAHDLKFTKIIAFIKHLLYAW
jgi:hypothetical protein